MVSKGVILLLVTYMIIQELLLHEGDQMEVCLGHGLGL